MRPLAGRRIWLVGIGGAGLSAYGLLARAWGAEVGGWDRNETPYLGPVREAGIEVRVSPEPEVPGGWETFVSSAYPGVEGRPRAELLAELVAAAPSIVVAGAHGKTTTAAMIAFALRETGRDPSWIVGGEVPQLGANAGAGEGWLVVEGDESDRSVAALRPRVAVVTNVDLDHHAEFGSRAEVEALFDAWLREVPDVVRGWELAPVEVELSVPGEHNRRNAGSALAALELAGVSRPDAEEAVARFAGTARRFEVHPGDVTIVDDYAHHPTEIAATIDAARERFPDARLRVLFQPHLYSRTRHLAGELAEALAAADDVTVTDVYPAREQPIDGVSGKLVIDALSDLGVLAAYTPTVEQGAARLARRAQPGDVLLVVGAGDVDRAVGLLGR